MEHFGGDNAYLGLVGRDFHRDAFGSLAGEGSFPNEVPGAYLPNEIPCYPHTGRVNFGGSFDQKVGVLVTLGEEYLVTFAQSLDFRGVWCE